MVRQRIAVIETGVVLQPEKREAMPEPLTPDVLVYVCRNCMPAGTRLPRQWNEDGIRVVVRETPCSGKIDVQYLLHALEGGAQGLCVAACPRGECTLAQGNYRAEIRVRTVQRLLGEIGLGPERAEIVHCSAKDDPRHLEESVRQAVGRLSALTRSPLREDSAREATLAKA